MMENEKERHFKNFKINKRIERKFIALRHLRMSPSMAFQQKIDFIAQKIEPLSRIIRFKIGQWVNDQNNSRENLDLELYIN